MSLYYFKVNQDWRQDLWESLFGSKEFYIKAIIISEYKYIFILNPECLNKGTYWIIKPIKIALKLTKRNKYIKYIKENLPLWANLQNGCWRHSFPASVGHTTDW